MPGKGRPPKPTHLKLVDGNPGKRPINENEPRPSKRRRFPSAPSTLGEFGKKEWARVGKELHRLNLLTELDMTAFHAYCDAYDRFRRMESILTRDGEFVVSKEGQLYQHPALGMLNRAREAMNKYLAEFGFTPSARARLHINPEEKVDPLEDFLFGTGG